MTNPVFHQEDCRFGLDDGVLGANTLMGTANNQNQTIDVDTTFRLIAVVQQTVTNKTFNNTIFTLYASYQGGSYFPVTTTSSYVKLVNDAYSIADHATTAQRIGDGTYTTGVDKQGWNDGQTDNHTGYVDWLAAAEIEAEFSLQIVGADLDDAHTLDFRVYESDDTAFGSYGTTLRATANKAASDDLTGKDLLAAAPLLESPVITRIVNLDPTDLLAAAPLLETPVITRIVNLDPTDLTAAAPLLETPTIGESGAPDALTGKDLLAAAPLLETPTITRIVNLDPTDLTAAAPLLETPTITRIVNLDPTDLTAGTPTLDPPTIKRITHLDPTDLTAGTPTMDSPALNAPPIDDLIAADLLAAAPLFDSPIFSAYTNTPDDRTSIPILDALSSTPASAARTSYPY